MNAEELECAMKLASEKFFSMSEEEHRAIRNNPKYDGPFYVLDYFLNDDIFSLTKNKKSSNKEYRRKVRRLARQKRYMTTVSYRRIKFFYESF